MGELTDRPKSLLLNPLPIPWLELAGKLTYTVGC